MQSQKSSTKEKRKPLPLPHGLGSMHFRGAQWQLVYNDAEGKLRFEGARTADAAEAQRKLAERTIPRVEAMLEQLRRIANGEETYQRNDKARAIAGRQKARRRAKAPGGNRQGDGKGGTQ